MNLETVGPFMPLILLFVIIYIIVIRPQRKTQEQRQEMIKNMKLINYCRNCGATLESNHKIVADTAVCTNCGFAPLNGVKFCQSCGETTQTGQSLCINCSSALVSNNPYIKTQVNDSSDSGVAIISFLLPLIGFILYATMLSNQPKRANSALTGALVGVVIGSVVFFFVFIFVLS